MPKLYIETELCMCIYVQEIQITCDITRNYIWDALRAKIAEHGVRNTGTVPLRLLYVFAADAFDQIKYTFSDP